jgi:hypothetical protein
MGPGPGVGTVPGWKFIKANSCYMSITNGIYQADPASFMIACVFSLNSNQILPSNLAGGNIFCVPNAFGEDIKFNLSYNGTSGQVVSYKQNSVTGTQTGSTVALDTLYIAVVVVGTRLWDYYFAGDGCPHHAKHVRRLLRGERTHAKHSVSVEHLECDDRNHVGIGVRGIVRIQHENVISRDVQVTRHIPAERKSCEVAGKLVVYGKRWA